MNTLAYIIYLTLTYFITFRVGLIFYKNGRVFIITMLDNNESLTQFINKMLLKGYYLLNLGYAALMLRSWNTIATWKELIDSVAGMTGRILLTLAVIHFFNMSAIYILSKRKNHYLSSKP
ncbi:hypothetical protein HNQ91_000570 [Filimonas zeae]|uniref:Uncharacterized protein n=1 Tax=Filimonas zeae TaxID=1737353 RepID=A0A917IQ24_9BACT|nr:hypothetical protein [Filimonas zeae]MDR6337548.1 hypothetical protein [Filimonas zeae]GGH59146.1 hypothetical protein GCM10011379_05610 [Filimonas zeae]